MRRETLGVLKLTATTKACTNQREVFEELKVFVCVLRVKFAFRLLECQVVGWTLRQLMEENCESCTLGLGVTCNAPISYICMLFHIILSFSEDPMPLSIHVTCRDRDGIIHYLFYSQ